MSTNPPLSPLFFSTIKGKEFLYGTNIGILPHLLNHLYFYGFVDVVSTRILYSKFIICLFVINKYLVGHTCDSKYPCMFLICGEEFHEEASDSQQGSSPDPLK